MSEARQLREGGVGVIPTETLYGLVAAARSAAAVERVYHLKGRAPEKPCIILISSVDDLGEFDVSLTADQRTALDKYWPGAVSIVLSCGAKAPEYLHRGTHTLAFRLPNDEQLRAFVRESGPLIAPSANPEGQPPATTIAEARAYFGENVDFYIDGGMLSGAPSTLIALDANGVATVLREGRGSVN